MTCWPNPDVKATSVSPQTPFLMSWKDTCRLVAPHLPLPPQCVLCPYLPGESCGLHHLGLCSQLASRRVLQVGMSKGGLAGGRREPVGLSLLARHLPALFASMNLSCHYVTCYHIVLNNPATSDFSLTVWGNNNT